MIKKIPFLLVLSLFLMFSCGKKTCPTYMTEQEVGLMELEMRGGDGKKPKKIKKDKFGRIRKRNWMQ